MDSASALRTGKRENGRAAIVVAVVLLVVIGLIVVAGGAAWYFLQKRAAPADFMSAMTQTAPESAQIFAAFDATRLGFGEATQKDALAALESSRFFKEIKKTVKEKLGLELDEDILAAIKLQGALFVAPQEGKSSFLSGIEQSVKTDVPPFRMCALLGLKDEQKALQVMQVVQGKVGVAYSTEEYEGVTIHVPEKAGKGPIWAIDRGILMLGFSSADLKMAVDGARNKGRSLKDNLRYQTALAKIKRKSEMVAYADLQGILQGEMLQKIEQKEVRDLVGALRFVVAGQALDGKDYVSEFLLQIDPQAGGVLASEVFKPQYGIDMKSVDLAPMESEMFMALNAKMIWQIAYDVMGHFPQGRMMRDMPAMQLQQKGIDLQGGILDPLSGELAVAMPNYSQIVAAQFGNIGNTNPTAALTAVQQTKFVVLLPLAQKEKIEALFQNPLLQPILASFATEDYKGTKIHSMMGQFAYGIHNDALVVGINGGDESIRKLIDDAASSQTIKARPGYSKLQAHLGGAKPVFLSFMNMEKVYSAAADQLEAKDQGTAKLIRLLSKAGMTWQAVTIRSDGVYGVGLTTDMKF